MEIVKNSTNLGKSKHIDVHFHIIRERLKEGSVDLEHVGGKEQIDDIFTKPLLTT